MEDRLFCDAHKAQSLDHRESENTLDLFDLIARTQNSRIDDQRCELPGSIHVSYLYYTLLPLYITVLSPPSL